MESVSSEEVYINEARKILVEKKGLCIAGGGVLGIAEVGAINRWIDQGADLSNLTHVVGSSVGSIISIIIANGGDIEYIKKTMGDLDLKKFKDGPNIFSKLWNLFRKFGWYSGNYLKGEGERILEELTGNGNITMLEAYERSGVHLTITYNSLNFEDVFYIDHITEPTTMLKDAMRMSASYPLFFHAIFRPYTNSSGKKARDVIIDGGTIDNYPLHVLRDQGLSDREILGLKLCSGEDIKEYALESGTDKKYDFGEPKKVMTYASRVLNLMRKTAMKQHVRAKDWMLTAKIFVGSMSSMNFDITKEETYELFRNGESAIDQLILDTAELLEKGEYPV